MFGFRAWRGGHRRGWLRPWVLAIVSRGPKNGAEIMDEIERMSWGGWRPSPGSIYPMLDEMATEGLVTKMGDGRYQITEKGKSEMEWPFGMPFQQTPRGVEDMLGEIGGYISYFEDLSKVDRSKLASYGARLKELGERLKRLGE
ncbi:MAG TPA: PadR family transcriptional regulator [Nitrososphaerales archaeon]|nr:PadR family transcriptional regulator [Nitrososphaerales archaeon]